MIALAYIGASVRLCLYEILLYIHQNPVVSGFVYEPEEQQFKSLNDIGNTVLPVDNHYEGSLSVNDGKYRIFPPSIADSCARIPTQVILADCRAFGNGSLCSFNALTNS